MIRNAARILAAIVLLTCVGTNVHAQPVAVVASFKGKVEITTSGAKTPVRAAFGKALEKGDKVVVGAGGAATLFFENGNVIELGEKSSITVGGKVERPKGTGLPGEVYANVSKFATAGSRQTGLVAMAEMRSGADDGKPILLAPRNSSVLSDAPTFSWRSVPGATRYRVRVSSAENGELWSREIPAGKPGEDLALTYPADAVKVAADADLLWEVEALDDSKSLRRESTTAHVLPAAKRDDVRANLDRIRASAGGAETPAACFLSGSYLSGVGLHHEAAQQFLALARLSPESPAAHEALGNVYSSIGLMDLAAAQFQQALTLERDTR